MGALYEKLIGTASNYLYSYMLIILLVGGGIFFTIRTKGVQVRYLITGTVPVITTHRTQTSHQKTSHPAIAAQPGALLNKGSRNLASTTAERQRAGKVSTTTSLHPRRSSLHQASPPDGSPGSGASAPANFGYFPSRESSSPAGETPPTPPAGETLPPSPKTKLPWTFTIHGSFSI